MKRFILAGVVAALVSCALGCAPQLQKAVKVGDREPATWVFISVEDKSYQGIYRCKETEAGPVCQKAKLQQ